MKLSIAKLRLPALLMAAVMVCAACTTLLDTGASIMGTGTSASSKKKTAIILQSSYGAAEMLSQQAGKKMGFSTPLQVMALANTAHPGENTEFGQMVSEQLATRLAQLGYTVVRGEGAKPSLSIGGSYTAVRSEVMVHIALMGLPDNRLISAIDYTVPMTRDVREMIKTEEEKRSPFDY